MSRNEEMIIVENALRLETETKDYKRIYEDIGREQFPSIPQPPAKAVIQKQPYPEIKPRKFSWIILILGWIIGGVFVSLTFGENTGTAFCAIWLIGYPIMHVIINKIGMSMQRDSSKYQEACRVIDEQYKNQVWYAQNDWNNRMAYYNSTIVPEYNNKRILWDTEHSQRLEGSRIKYQESEAALNKYYAETSAIPLKYHNIEALTYLYDVLKSSQYTLKEAIDDYERHIQQQLDMQKIQAQQQANDIAYQQAQFTAEQNELLDEQNRIAEKTRRDQNVAAAIGIVQRHNLNKKL